MERSRAPRPNRLPSVNLPFDATWTALILAALGAVCLGFSKTGFPGLAIVNVLLVAEVFGAKNSIGIILPMLVLCDLLVLPLFWKHAAWRQVWPLVPVTFLSIAVAAWLLGQIHELSARRLIGGIILLMLALQVLREWRRDFLAQLPDSRPFRWFSCVLIGVSTTLANAAGPVYSIYALARRLPKMEFLGIGARFFLLVNLFKVPFLGHLELINAESLRLNLLLLPALLVGILCGRKLIRRVPQRVFELLLYLFSLVAGARLLFW